MWEKLKSLIQNDQVFFSVLVVCASLASFTLGRSSVVQNAQQNSHFPLNQTVTVTKTSVKAKAAMTDNNITSEVQTLVASRSGTKYHRSDCPGASQIKLANLITFQTAAAAEAAGYTPAANCPGL